MINVNERPASHKAEPNPNPPTWPAIIAMVERRRDGLTASVGDPDEMIAQMWARDVLGRSRYGVPLAPNNGRDSLVDAREEGLDMIVYLYNAWTERPCISLQQMIFQAMEMVLKINRVIAFRDEEAEAAR